MEDYAALQPALRHLHYTLGWGKGREYCIGLAHPHRLWEYASAITTMTEAFGDDLTNRIILDVGSGPSALGPTLAMRYGCQVTELDPFENLAPLRAPLIEAMKDRGYEYTYRDENLMTTKTRDYDGVFSISVMEHLPAEEQEEAWRRLASLVIPGGVLVATIDFGAPDKPWRHDTGREVKLGAAEVTDIARWLTEEGITLTPLDTKYHGPQVFDYTFFRLVGTRAAV